MGTTSHLSKDSTPHSTQKSKNIYYTITSVAVSTAIVSLVSYVIIPLISSYEPSITTSSYGTISSYIVQLLSGLIGKEYLDPLRLLIGTIWFTALYMFIRKNEHSINTLTSGALSLLGRNALFVYCLHAIILLIIDTILRPFENNTDIIVNTLLAAVFISVLYITTKLKVKY